MYKAYNQFCSSCTRIPYITTTAVVVAVVVVAVAAVAAVPLVAVVGALQTRTPGWAYNTTRKIPLPLRPDPTYRIQRFVVYHTPISHPPGPIFHARYQYLHSSWNRCRCPKARRSKHLVESFPKTCRSVSPLLAPSWLPSNRAWKTTPGGGVIHT